MYKMKRCPYCGRQIDMAAIGMKFKVAYGSPFRTCPKCHKEYIDRDYQEVALKVQRQRHSGYRRCVRGSSGLRYF